MSSSFFDDDYGGFGTVEAFMSRETKFHPSACQKHNSNGIAHDVCPDCRKGMLDRFQTFKEIFIVCLSRPSTETVLQAFGMAGDAMALLAKVDPDRPKEEPK